MNRSIKTEILRTAYWDLACYKTFVAQAKFNCGDDDIMMLRVLEMSLLGIVFNLYSFLLFLITVFCSYSKLATNVALGNI